MRYLYLTVVAACFLSACKDARAGSKAPEIPKSAPDENCGEARIVKYRDEEKANKLLDRGFHIEKNKVKKIERGENYETFDGYWVLRKDCKDPVKKPRRPGKSR